MNTLAALNAYNQVGAETAVHEADPHQLILLLFRGAISAVTGARSHMERREIAAKGEKVSKAIDILDALRVSLDMEAGGDLARNLSDLYEYMTRRLFLANLKNDVAGLEEVQRLLSDLLGAWEAIDTRKVIEEANRMELHATAPGA